MSFSVSVLREVRVECMQPKHILASPGKKNILKNPCNSLYRLEHAGLIFVN